MTTSNALAIAGVIAQLAGAPAATRIVCTGHMPKDEAGWAVIAANGTPTMLLDTWTCRNLSGLRHLPVDDGAVYFGEAAHIVVHEASHLAGVWNEYQAESRAQRLLPVILRRIVRQLSRGYDYRVLYRNALYGSRSWHNSLPLCYRENVPCR